MRYKQSHKALQQESRESVESIIYNLSASFAEFYIPTPGRQRSGAITSREITVERTICNKFVLLR